MWKIILVSLFLISCTSAPVIVKNTISDSELIGLALNPPTLPTNTTDEANLPKFVVELQEKTVSYVMTENDVLEMIQFLNTSNAAIAERNVIIEVLNRRLSDMQSHAEKIVKDLETKPK